jgi:hypothetical protein
MDRIDLTTVPSAMEETARAWGAAISPRPAETPRTPRALPPRAFAPAGARLTARKTPSPYQPARTEEERLADAALAREDALRSIARDVMDPADKARELGPTLAEAMVNAAHSGNFDYYLRHETDPEIKRALFRLGCVGSRGPADKRYWLGPYGSKVRLALLEDETS